MDQAAEVLVLGGGIHGVGVLHDLVSRGFKKVILMEKGKLASGTSSKSTKLIHGGLRYLERPKQFSMVYESLRERKLLLELASDIVKPIEFLIPIPKGSNFESIKMKLGLGLYDLLAKDSLIERYKSLSLDEAYERAPLLKGASQIKKIYSYWDAQTDDRLLVQRVARSAEALGGKILEDCVVQRLRNEETSWKISFRHEGKNCSIRAPYVISCLGPWSNQFLENNGIQPTHQGKNNKGTHIILPSLGLKSALLLRAIDQRVFFMIPWFGKTLIGTTEKDYTEDPSTVTPEPEEIDYLLRSCNEALSLDLKKEEIESSFSGLRWLVEEEGTSLSKNSRESVLGRIDNASGFLLTIYGGKLTSYRRLCERIGDLLTSSSGKGTESKTHLKEFWA